MSGWPLYRDIRALCKDMGEHASVAPHLAGQLMRMGAERVGDVYGMSLGEIAEGPRVGPAALRVARALGAVEGGAP